MTSALFGGIPFPTQGGDRLVSKVISAAIAALFKRTEKAEANVRIEPLTKLLQGSIDGFDFLGQGMEMYNGLRLEGMELYLQAVAIDVGAVFNGKVRLKQPTQAVMRIVLTEDDLTTSFNTPFVKDKLQRLQYDGQPLAILHTRMTLDSPTSLHIEQEVQVGEAPPLAIDFTTEVEVQERRRIQFVNVTYQGSEAAVEVAQALVGHVNNLLDLDTFALEGTQLRVDRMRLQNRKLIFYGTADIEQFPQKQAQKAAAKATS